MAFLQGLIVKIVELLATKLFGAVRDAIKQQMELSKYKSEAKKKVKEIMKEPDAKVRAKRLRDMFND